MPTCCRKLLFLTVLLVTFPLAIPNTVQARSDPGSYTSRPTTHTVSGLTLITPGANAYDSNTGTSTDFKLDTVGSFTVKGFTSGSFSSTDIIAMVDIHMWYDVSGGGKADRKISFYVRPSSTEMILEPWNQVGHTGTEDWNGVNDPNNLDWSWTDISNLEVVVSCGNVGSGGAKTFEEFEVWVTVYYYNEPTLYVDPTSTTKSSGQSFSIDINITGFTAGNWSGGVYGWEFKLYYNGTLLNGTSATEGTYLSSVGTTSYFALNFSDTLGLAWLTCTLRGHTAGKTGGGVLASISFYVNTDGNTNFVLNSTKLAGYDFLNKRIYEITHSAVSGSFQTPGAVPEFPYGAALEIAVVAVLVSLWWKRKRKKGSPKLSQNPAQLS